MGKFRGYRKKSSSEIIKNDGLNKVSFESLAEKVGELSKDGAALTSFVRKYIENLDAEKIEAVCEELSLVNLEVSDTETFTHFITRLFNQVFAEMVQGDLKQIHSSLIEKNTSDLKKTASPKPRQSVKIESDDWLYEYKKFIQENLNQKKHEKLRRFFEEKLPNKVDVKIYENMIHTILPNWNELIDTLSNQQLSNVDLVKKTDEITRQFLHDIEGVYVPIRKPLLNFVADVCNQYFTEFEFISPEKYTEITPEYHNIIGRRGLRIASGLSFLIIRKDNKNTFSKADVKAL